MFHVQVVRLNVRRATRMLLQRQFTSFGSSTVAVQSLTRRQLPACVVSCARAPPPTASLSLLSAPQWRPRRRTRCPRGMRPKDPLTQASYRQGWGLCVSRLRLRYPCLWCRRGQIPLRRRHSVRRRLPTGPSPPPEEFMAQAQHEVLWSLCAPRPHSLRPCHGQVLLLEESLVQARRRWVWGL